MTKPYPAQETPWGFCAFLHFRRLALKLGEREGVRGPGTWSSGALHL